MSEVRLNRRRPRFAALLPLLAAALAACGGSAEPAPATLQSISIDASQVYATVGVPQQLSVSGQYSDGSSAAVTGDLTWSSSDEAVATVDARGLVTPWKSGTARIVARHGGLTAGSDLTARVVVAARFPTGLPAISRVDTGTTFMRISGLVAGELYDVSVTDMSDDVDLSVFSDASLGSDAELCWSGRVGKTRDTCVAPANPAGELWVAIDGEWTVAGADFALDVSAAQPKEIAGTLAYPGDLPFAGAIEQTRRVYALTGLVPAAKYEVRISNLSADIDVAVYGDDYLYALQCESYADGTVDDFCTATANPDGKLFVEVDGETTRNGGTYTLGVTKQ